MPDAPYVVVKAESGAIAGTRQFRIIAHANMGLQDELENYLNIELSTLLIKDGNEKVFIIDGAGNRYRLQSSGAGTETIMGNDDGTIAMERIFSLPTMFE
jgi:hypothetical protein